MKIVYYTTPSFLDLGLMFVQELSKLVELHFLLEISPESRKNTLLDVAHKSLPEGISDATHVLRDCFPESVQKYWQDCASFNLLVYNCPKSIHPASWRTSQRGANFISSINPDIVNLDEISLRQAWSLLMLKKRHLVLSVHDPEYHSGESNWRDYLARYLTFPKVDKFLLHNTLQVAPFLIKYKLNADQASSIPLGAYNIFREWQTEPKKEDGKTILFFGRISLYKGLDVLFRAAPRIAAKIPGVRIIVAGKPVAGYTMPAPPDLAAKGKVEIISEYISNSQLADLFNQSTVVVCPYLDATQSGVVLTSYAFNRPVVATDTGGLSEYVKHMKTGLIVQPGDGFQLAEALVKILLDKEMQTKFKSGIKDLITEELSWQNIARQTYDVYKKVSKSK